jgi:hypothetical protein
MRQAFSEQQQFDAPAIRDIPLNFECRDEIVPLLAALQHVYSQPGLRVQILDLIEADVNQHTRSDVGRGPRSLVATHAEVLCPPRAQEWPGVASAAAATPGLDVCGFAVIQAVDQLDRRLIPIFRFLRHRLQADGFQFRIEVRAQRGRTFDVAVDDLGEDARDGSGEGQLAGQ